MVTAERRTIIPLKNEFQERLINRAHEIREELTSSEITFKNTSPAYSIIKDADTIVEYLFRSGLEMKQIEDLIGFRLYFTTAEEQEKIYKSKTSGVIFQADKLLNKP